MFLGYPYFSFQPWQFGETDYRATKRTWLWGYFKKPTFTVRQRDYSLLPKVSQNSPRKDGYVQDKSRVNTGFIKATKEDRAKTSKWFAEAFYKANN